MVHLSVELAENGILVRSLAGPNWWAGDGVRRRLQCLLANLLSTLFASLCEVLPQGNSC
jgi:hypothetical protein